MKYYCKAWKAFFNTFAFFILWIIIACFHIFLPTESEKRNGNHFYFYLLCVWGIMLISHIIRNYRYIVLWIKNEAILEVNEVYIFDCVHRVKYFWDDIKEVMGEGQVLYISVHDTEMYLPQFKTQISRYYHYSKARKAFILPINCVKAKIDVLINTMNDYSIKAEETKIIEQ